MSAFREENPADKFVKVYITARLEQAAHSQFLRSSDELVDYLLETGGLDRTCSEWIKNAPNAALRELLKDHQRKYNQYHSGVGQAPNGAAGPSVPRFGNQLDSTYFSSDPGSPMSQVSHSRDPSFNVFLVPAAAPDTEAIPVLARIDGERDTHLIDYDIARSLCGDRIREGQGVRVCWRQTQDDQSGGSTSQIQCIVGRIQEVNIVFARDFGRSKAQAETGSHRGFSPMDNATDFDREWAKNAALLLQAKTDQDVQRIRKRPPEDDDGGQHLAQRQRRGG